LKTKFLSAFIGVHRRPKLIFSQLLRERLPAGAEEDEKRVFTVQFLRRAVPFDSGPLDDSETADATDQLLASLE
jgi:hypothetical protein